MKIKGYLLLSILILLQMLSLSMCTKEQYTITFDTQGGSVINQQLVNDGGFVILPQQPVKLGYKFMGWYIDSNCTNRFLSSNPITKDITIYAKWELTEMPALDTLIKNQNYKYDLDYKVGEVEYIEHYEYSPNVLKQSFNNSTEYLVKKQYSYYVVKVQNEYVGYDEFSKTFKENEKLFFSFEINEIDINNWYLDEFVYRPIDTKFNEETTKVLGYHEDVEELYLYINYNLLNADIIFSDGSKYHLVLEYVEDLEVTVPNFKYKIDEQYISITEALEKNNNQIVVVNAAILADLGEYYYGLDSTGGMFIEKDNLKLDLSYYYKTKGVIQKTNQAYLDSIISYEKTNTYVTTTPSDILSPRNITNQNIDILVYFNNFIVSNIETDGDYNIITVKYNDDFGKIVSHKSFSWNDDFNVNDIISIDEGVIQKYENEVVIYLTSKSNVSFGEIKIQDLETPSTISIEQGADMNAFLSSLSINAIYNNGVKTKIDSSKYSIIGELDLNTVGQYEITIKAEDISKTIIVFVSTYSEYGTYDDDAVDLDTLINQNNMQQAMPRSGDAKILVIPILFPDYNNCPNMKENLEKAFFGSYDVNGYYSLSEYYQLSSFGKLNISGDVVSPFTVSRESSYYRYHENGDGKILEEALDYYKNTLDLSNYDGNNDGVIDGIYLIYNHPTSTNDDSFWWAYVTNNQNYHTKYDDMKVNYYCFAGYEFIFEKLSDGSTVSINSTTYIHETGHMLGLTDYYDYDESIGISGGLGGGDMMDHNVGDHNPFSKALLGWITPLILEKENMTLELESYSKTGECFIIPYNWNGTYFDEYLIIDYYTPTDLYKDLAGTNGLFSQSGLRIYHIQASEKDSLSGILSIFKNDNSYTTNKLITLIENDMSNFIGDDNKSTNEDLFDVLDTFQGFKWSDGTSLNLSIKVNSKTEDKITLTISIE